MFDLRRREFITMRGAAAAHPNKLLDLGLPRRL
jgi:hypothetical protein